MAQKTKRWLAGFAAALVLSGCSLMMTDIDLDPDDAGAGDVDTDADGDADTDTDGDPDGGLDSGL